MIAGSVGISESSGYQSGSNAYKKGDFVTALQHWTIAAQKGDVRAQFNVATMHFKGRGTPKNDRIAVKWYTLAAKQGCANAQFSLGLMYDNGNGVPTDADSAIKWHTLAAKTGKCKRAAQFRVHVQNRKGRSKGYENSFEVVQSCCKTRKSRISVYTRPDA